MGIPPKNISSHTIWWSNNSYIWNPPLAPPSLCRGYYPSYSWPYAFIEFRMPKRCLIKVILHLVPCSKNGHWTRPEGLIHFFRKQITIDLQLCDLKVSIFLTFMRRLYRIIFDQLRINRSNISLNFLYLKALPDKLRNSLKLFLNFISLLLTFGAENYW